MNNEDKRIGEGRCPKCGEEIEESTDKFCRFCRQSLAEFHIHCQHCDFSYIEAMHNELPNYCPMCGKDWPKSN